MRKLRTNINLRENCLTSKKGRNGVKRLLKVCSCILILLVSLSQGVSGYAAQADNRTRDVTLKYVNTDDSMINNTYETLENQVKSAVNAVEMKLSQLYDLNTELLDGYISQAQIELEKLKELKTKIGSEITDEERTALLAEFNYSQTVTMELCQKIVVASAESKVVSARSAWHRPCEKNYAEIKANVEMFKEIGINLIFVETFYHGCSVFKSDLIEFPYHPSLAASYKDTEKNIVYDDYLSAFAACCAEYGIEVHAWVENFYVGINENATILQNHPTWIVYNDDGSFLQRKEGGLYIFIDPANPDVQDALINYYNILFKEHPEIKGLNLDYIRYPVSNRSLDTGYTMSAMKGFYQSLGKEFSSTELYSRSRMANKFKELFDKNYLPGGQAEADANYALWVEYRTQIITDYVHRIKDEVKDPNGIILSTAVFTPLSDSISAKKADWKSWIANGWIDIATPMAYYTSSSVVQSKVKEMILTGGNNCLYYTGIASSYSGLPAWQNKEFIEASYKAGANGYVIFSSAQIIGHDDVQLVLNSGVNNKWAVLPHAEINAILSASFGDILDKANRLYIPAGGMNEKGRAELEAAFAEIMAMSDETAEEIEDILAAIRLLADEKVKSCANGYSCERITEQLDELAEILDARASMLTDEDGEQDLGNGSDAPSGDDTQNGVNTDTDEDTDTDAENRPEDGNAASGQKLNIFQIVWNAIVSFFKRLFGVK